MSDTNESLCRRCTAPMVEGGSSVFVCCGCASQLPTVGSRWWLRYGSTYEGPWTVQEVSHNVRLYLPNPLSPCGAFSYIPIESWPAGYIGVAR